MSAEDLEDSSTVVSMLNTIHVFSVWSMINLVHSYPQKLLSSFVFRNLQQQRNINSNNGRKHLERIILRDVHTIKANVLELEAESIEDMVSFLPSNGFI